ncbi:hypothetical protein BLNAU_34 [Blattamonas nauphoetae]|uniref:Uncharacterized protein n=1 Tax=Blattamonas nauphoetae TaxID=2049346 RepID=A0ABQ9YLV1_9EUKA|nr:hypothetical protein BLNAU_34 [Blattamonas nauphoetae]
MCLQMHPNPLHHAPGYDLKCLNILQSQNEKLIRESLRFRQIQLNLEDQIRSSKQRIKFLEQQNQQYSRCIITLINLISSFGSDQSIPRFYENESVMLSPPHPLQCLRLSKEVSHFSGRVTSLAFEKSTNHFLAGSPSGIISFYWDTYLLCRWSLPVTPPRFHSSVTAIWCFADVFHLRKCRCFVVGDDEGRLSLFPLIEVPKEHPKGKRLYKPSQLLHTYRDHHSPVVSFHIFKQLRNKVLETLLISGERNGTIILWKAHSTTQPEPKVTIPAHLERLTSLSCIPAGTEDQLVHASSIVIDKHLCIVGVTKRGQFVTYTKQRDETYTRKESTISQPNNPIVACSHSNPFIEHSPHLFLVATEKGNLLSIHANTHQIQILIPSSCTSPIPRPTALSWSLSDSRRFYTGDSAGRIHYWHIIDPEQGIIQLECSAGPLEHSPCITSIHYVGSHAIFATSLNNNIQHWELEK